MTSMTIGLRGGGRRISAFVAAVSFAAIALSSLIVDQAVDLSASAAANGKIELVPAWIGNCLSHSAGK